MNYSWIAYEQALQALPRYLSPEWEVYEQLCQFQSALKQNIEQAHLQDSPELASERKILVVELNNFMKQKSDTGFIDICMIVNPALQYCAGIYQVMQKICALFGEGEIWNDSYQAAVQELRQNLALNGIARDRSDISVSLYYVHNDVQQLLSIIDDFEEYCLPNNRSPERVRNKQTKIYEKLKKFVGEVHHINNTYFKELLDIWLETTSATAGIQSPHVIDQGHPDASSVISDATDVHIQPSVAQIDATETEIQSEEVKNTSVNRPASAISSVNRTSLREAIVNSFGKDDLKILCTDISQSLQNDGIIHERIMYDSLGGEAKRGKVHSLIECCEQRGWLAYLVQEVQKVRPNLVF